MKINSINNQSFTNKCHIEGSVSALKEVAGNISKNGAEVRIFHPSGIVHPKQSYADVIIANENDVQRVDEFLNSNDVWSDLFGKFGTSDRGVNIMRTLWKNEKIKTLKAENVLDAMNNNKFDYKTLDINA